MKRLPSPRLTRRVIITGQWSPVIYSPETCMHGLACTLPAERAAIFSSSLPDYLPFLPFSSSLIGYRQALLWGLIVELTVHAPTRRVCFSPLLVFCALLLLCISPLYFALISAVSGHNRRGATVIRNGKASRSLRGSLCWMESFSIIRWVQTYCTDPREQLLCLRCTYASLTNFTKCFSIMNYMLNWL